MPDPEFGSALGYPPVFAATLNWRRILHFKAGVGKYIKRKMNKRIRKEGKDESKQGLL